jgi:hypothetical protein
MHRSMTEDVIPGQPAGLNPESRFNFLKISGSPPARRPE